MPRAFIPVAELRERLLLGGHVLDEDGDQNTDVYPPPDVIVTVATNLDPTQAPTHRERYFATLLDRQGDRPRLRLHADFALPEPFPGALTREMIGGRYWQGNFLLGPFRWAVRRLVRFPRVLLWPEHQIWASEGFVTDPWVLDEMPHLRRCLRTAGAVPRGAGAIELDPTDLADCRVLWEVAEQVEAGFYNYFLSDPQLNEVYELHHHSKVIVSIPESLSRVSLLAELARWPQLFEDCSASRIEWEDPVGE